MMRSVTVKVHKMNKNIEQLLCFQTMYTSIDYGSTIKYKYHKIIIIIIIIIILCIYKIIVRGEGLEAALSFKMTQWSSCVGESVCYWLEKGNSM